MNSGIKVYFSKLINFLFDAISLFISIHIANLEFGVKR